MAEKQQQSVSGDTTIALTFDQLKELIASNKSLSIDEQRALMQEQADLTAKAHQKLARPENITHSGISVYSREGGELANPKGELPFKRILWGGTQDAPEMLTAEEHDLFLQVNPGNYTIRRPDGSRFTVAVAMEKNDITGKIDLLDVRFPTRGKLKDGLPSKVDMLRQMIAQSPESAVSLVR